jgi:hypothetical protein
MGDVDERQSRGRDVHTSSPDSIYLNLTRKCSENHRGFPNTKRRTAPPLYTTQRSLKFVDKPNNGNRKTTEDRVSFVEHVVVEKTRHVRYVKRKSPSRLPNHYRNIGEASSSFFFWFFVSSSDFYAPSCTTYMLAYSLPKARPFYRGVFRYL